MTNLTNRLTFYNVVNTSSNNNFGFSDKYMYNTSFTDYTNTYSAWPDTADTLTHWRFQPIADDNKLQTGDTTTIWVITSLDDGSVASNTENTFTVASAMTLVGSAALLCAASALI